VNPARREPLLWLQLLGLAAVPLEALLLLLVLAGADPGPFPGFERLLSWSLGSLAPAVLFWRLPPDLWSLLLLQVPLRGRRPEQLRLSALQTALPLQLLSASGTALLLPLVWWADRSAGVAWAWSPLASSPRLVGLLLSLPVLAVIQWQWHQLIQALWMFSRPAVLVEGTLPLSQAQAADQRLNLGLPLLLLPPLASTDPGPGTVPAATQEPTPAEATPAPEPESQPEPEPEAQLVAEPVAELEPAPEPVLVHQAEPDPALEPLQEASLQEASEEAQEPPVARSDEDLSAASHNSGSEAVLDAGVAVTPEETAEEHERTNLDT
jgi:hypothetical protein